MPRSRQKTNSLTSKGIYHLCLLYLIGISSVAINTAQKIPTEMKVPCSVDSVLATVIAVTRISVTCVRKVFISQVSKVTSMAYTLKYLRYFLFSLDSNSQILNSPMANRRGWRDLTLRRIRSFALTQDAICFKNSKYLTLTIH